MPDHTIPDGPLEPDRHVIYEFTPDMEATWTVNDGDSLTVRTIDGLMGDIQTEDDLVTEVPPEVNGATGPIAIAGSQPGDILKVDIENIRVTESIGRVTVIPGFGLQQDHDHLDTPRTRITPITDNTVTFEGIKTPVAPVIGTIGVAPAADAYTTVVPHDHGGNLDTKDITTGNTVYFPVFQPGAHLAMGDCKAVMRDGEISGTGAEVATEIDLTVHVITDPAIPLNRPLIETPDAWKTVASAETLETACELANQDLIALLRSDHDLDFTDAYMLTSLISDLEISQVVDPLLTVRNAVPKDHLTVPL